MQPSTNSEAVRKAAASRVLKISAHRVSHAVALDD